VRSNFTVGVVYVDEPEFADQLAYDYTISSGQAIYRDYPELDKSTV
jgi:hypothetical protein